MTSRKPWFAALVGIIALPAMANAQFPTPSAGAAPGFGGSGLGPAGAAAAPAAAGLAAPAAPRTLWSFLGLSPTSLQNAQTTIHACRDKFCQSQFGQMVGGFTSGPLSGLTGGFIPSLCPPAPSAAALSALESQSGPMGAEAVAGKIKQSEADAKARVAAIEYLGTVDCNRWKEARIALINGLRADPSECVRYAAARVLNTGCCCSKPVIEALRVCVSGEDTDGNPPETSQRVKAAAFSALQNCLMRVPEDLPPEQPPPVRERDRGGPVPALEPLPAAVTEGRHNDPKNTDSVAHEHLVAAHTAPAGRTPAPERRKQPKTFGQTVNEARKTLFQVSQNPTPPTTLPAGKRTLLHAFLKARHDLAHQQAAEAAEATAEADPTVGRESQPRPIEREADRNPDGPAE
jgi:hypothetical protein